MPFHTGVFGNGTIYLTPPANVPNGTRAYVYILGQDEDPASFYRRLVMLEPEDASLYTQLGLAQLNAGRLADAEASLNRAVQLDFGYAEAHFNLGRCYERQEQFDSARQSYQAAAELDIEHKAAHQKLIGLLVQLGDEDAIFAALTTAFEGVPDLREWAETAEMLASLRDGARWSALADE